MSFVEQLKAAEKYGLNIIDLRIAAECKLAFQFDYTDEEFERLREFAKDICFKANASERATAKAINRSIYYGNKTIAEICKTDAYIFMRKYALYL